MKKFVLAAIAVLAFASFASAGSCSCSGSQCFQTATNTVRTSVETVHETRVRFSLNLQQNHPVLYRLTHPFKGLRGRCGK